MVNRLSSHFGDRRTEQELSDHILCRVDHIEALRAELLAAERSKIGVTEYERMEIDRDCEMTRLFLTLAEFGLRRVRRKQRALLSGIGFSI